MKNVKRQLTCSLTQSIIALCLLAAIVNAFGIIQMSVPDSSSIDVGADLADSVTLRSLLAFEAGADLSILALLRVITSMFVHANLFHLVMNMIVLYALGCIVERGIKKEAYLSLYIISGIVAAFTQHFFQIYYTGETVPIVGASGAVIGLFGFLVVENRLLPEAKRHLLRYDLAIFAGVTAALLYAFGFNYIAHAAHGGGLLTGALFGLLSRLGSFPTIPKSFTPITYLSIGAEFSDNELINLFKALEELPNEKIDDLIENTSITETKLRLFVRTLLTTGAYNNLNDNDKTFMLWLYCVLSSKADVEEANKSLKKWTDAHVKAAHNLIKNSVASDERADKIIKMILTMLFDQKSDARKNEKIKTF